MPDPFSVEIAHSRLEDAQCAACAPSADLTSLLAATQTRFGPRAGRGSQRKSTSTGSLLPTRAWSAFLLFSVLAWCLFVADRWWLCCDRAMRKAWRNTTLLVLALSWFQFTNTHLCVAVNRLKFMLKHTMGSDTTFEFRRQELALLAKVVCGALEPRRMLISRR